MLSPKKNPTVFTLAIDKKKEEFNYLYILYILVFCILSKIYSMNVLIQEELFVNSRNHFGKIKNGKVIYFKASRFLFKKDECYYWSDKVIL